MQNILAFRFANSLFEPIWNRRYVDYVKPAVLAAIKKLWKSRVTTVFVRQGHCALDPEILAPNPHADLSVRDIGDLLKYDTPSMSSLALTPASLAVAARLYRPVLI